MLSAREVRWHGMLLMRFWLSIVRTNVSRQQRLYILTIGRHFTPLRQR